MNCVSSNYDIVIQEGGTYDKTFRWTNKDTGVPIPLFGCTGIMQGRKKYSDPLPLIDLPFVSTPWVADVKSGIYILDDNVTPSLLGTFRMYITNEDTKGKCDTFKDIIGVYNLFLYNSLGEAILNRHGVMTIEVSAAR